MNRPILKSCGLFLPAFFCQTLFAQPPTSVSVSPSSGSGTSQTFTFTAASVNGYTDLAWLQIIFNWGVTSPGACYFYFAPASNLIYLNSDDGGVTSGNGWVGSANLGTSGTLQNSQCGLNLASASFSGSGNNLTLNLPLTFKPGLPGPQNIFMAVGDNQGLVGNWTQLGSWTAWPLATPGQAPTLVSASPSSGVGGLGAWQMFSYTASSPNGVTDILQFQALLNTGINGAGACYTAYFPQQNAIYLYNDTASAVTLGAPGSTGTLSNSQCTLNLAASSAVISGNNLTLNLALTFSSAFAGTKNEYLYVEDRQYNVGGWAQMGTWTVAAPPVAAPVFTPEGGIYSASQSVSLSSATAGATIRYTIDGSAPTETHGTVYAGPFPVTAQVTINAIAYEAGWSDSAVTAETYYFSDPTGGTGGGTGNGFNTGPPPNTPPADSGNGLDPRRIGVRALGSYWGDAGENLDMNSGNLSFANTLIKPMGRGGWSLPLMLSYNSQMWRHDSGGDWLLGQDVGYGMGWKLQAGSLTPVWASTSAIDHYIFTDASGAEYSLTVNTGGVWTSLEGVYISYDSNANKLYNTDGSFWVMGCTAAGTEQDAGSMYPTLAEDTNGNLITINYLPGQGMGAANTSARISSIVDTRGTYAFTYSQLSPNDDIVHLVSVTGQPGEGWAMNYSSLTLDSPLSGAGYGATKLLYTLQQTGSNGVQPPAAVFSYNGGAEMTRYTTPMGGSISWGYRNFTYAGNIALREVNSRSMNQGAGGFSNTHYIYRSDSTDAGLTYHYSTEIYDTGAATAKNYYNLPAGSGSSLIVPVYYLEYTPNVNYSLQKNYGWGQNAAGNTYMSSFVNILDPGASSQIYSVTYQTLDNYGNLTQQQVYDYGASSVTRTYNLTYLTDSNYINRYIRNRLTSATATANGVNTPLALNSYDGTTLGALQNATDANGFPTTLSQHDTAYDTTFAYRGNSTSTWRVGGATMSYAYNVGGLAYKMQDGDGLTVTTVQSLSTAYSLPATVTPNANANLATSFTYTPSFAPASVTGANGATQSVNYDGYNRPASTTSVDGAMTNYVYAFGPNTQTASISTTANNVTTTQWKRTTFDGFGRTIKVETGHDGTTYNTVDTGYGACGCSPLGKVIKTSLPYGPGETEVWTTYTYDASGRQLTSTAPDGSVTTTSYSGNSVTTTDPAGAWKTNVMDAFGNLTSITEPDPTTGTTTSASPVTSYAYNGANQLTNVSMTRGGVTQNRTFAYSGGDLASETTPEAGTVTYTYDNNHHVTQRIDALNQKTTYAYDSYERLTTVQHYTWGPSPSCNINCPNVWNEQALQDVNYYYDIPVAGGYNQGYTWGRLSAVLFHVDTASTSFAYEYSYNQAGRVTGNRMLVTNAGANGHVDIQGQYAWDNQGRMTSMTYPSGPVMNYQFDAMGRPSAMTETACIYNAGNGCQNGTWNAGYATYGSANQILTVGGMAMYPGSNTASVGETRTYNNMLQVTHLTSSAQGYQYPSTYSGGGVDMQYLYNTGHNNGRVAQTIDNTLGETVNYSYDHLHRLTGATATNASWGEGYSYDGFGNLTGKTPTVGTAPVFQGSAGSNAAGGALPPNFDVENRLTASNPVGVPDTYTYVYDPWGRRVWKQDYNVYSGTTTAEAYFYGATGQKLETYGCGWGVDGSLGGSSEGINTYFAGKMLSEKGVFIATDRLGSVRGDSNGVNISYFPWGEERGQGTADNRTKFAGYYRDMPGQDYANARYYSATSGSFWSPDPGGTTAYSPSAGWLSTVDYSNPGSWNRYPYVNGDPVNRIDPTGMIQCDASADDGCVYNIGYEVSVNGDCDGCAGAGGGNDDTGDDGDTGSDDCGAYGTQIAAAATSGICFSDTPPPPKTVPPPTGPDGNPLPPPVPLPPGKLGQPNTWVPGPGKGHRPVRWGPKHPVTVPGGKGGQPGASWDPDHGHWDWDNGCGQRNRCLPDGTPVDHNNNPMPVIGTVSIIVMLEELAKLLGLALAF